MTTQNGSADQRRYPRFSLALQVNYEDSGEYLCEWTENLSAGGLFIRTEREFTEGDVIRMSLSFPGLLQAVEISGRVAWIRPGGVQPGGIGVEVTGEPARRRLADLALKASNPKALRAKQTFRVLVVEDNPRVTRSYERVLQHLSDRTEGQVQTCFAPNGFAAIGILEKQPCDLIVTDLYMPVMDGFTLIKKVRQNPNTATIPIIVITAGRGDEEQRVRGLGVDGFLQKPIQFSHLFETIVCLVSLHSPGP